MIIYEEIFYPGIFRGFFLRSSLFRDSFHIGNKYLQNALGVYSYEKKAYSRMLQQLSFTYTYLLFIPLSLCGTMHRFGPVCYTLLALSFYTISWHSKKNHLKVGTFNSCVKIWYLIRDYCRRNLRVCLSSLDTLKCLKNTGLL